MAKKQIINKASYWSDTSITGIEFLSAHYTSHEFSPHTHEGYAVGVVESGAQSFRYKSLFDIIPAGNIMVIHPNEVHTGRCVGGNGCAYRMMYIKPELLRNFMPAIHGRPERDLYFPNQSISDPDLAQKIKTAHQIFENPSSALIEKETRLYSMLMHLISEHSDSKRLEKLFRPGRYYVKKAKRFLEDQYHTDMSLKTLAENVNISPYHLLRMFTEEFGIPPHAYLTQVRIQAARKYLSQGMSIAEVAQETGFCDQSQFTRRFKQIVGTTPGLFQKKPQ